ncbi:putative Long chain acyl-CoA synthetase 7, peroxisomal [Blattamonas nauphoetae]|uniref:Long chain acyl-CoA synthetase 7, peroxisomal n=1 Tax=Blattamonas nauphoetae TaxID=2049346 RepID=A0ABQ9XKK0_9EUKA|nr:putative Long chain acyl-CoA synthetase 7, peroxisomal [Blattamonas nauphoetae]
MSTDHNERGPVHRTANLTSYSTSYFQPDGLTIKKLVRTCCERYPDNDHLGYREYLPDTTKRGQYIWLKYRDVNDLITFVGSGLRHIGLVTGDKVGIMATNCVEWSLTDYAIACQSFVCVPVYDSYGENDCQTIVVHSDMRAIVVQRKQLPFAVSIKASGVAPLLEYIILIDDASSTSTELPQGVTHKFSDIVALGKANPVPDQEPLPGDVFTIVYTSGTTGVPKGAMISHNAVAVGSINLMTRATPSPNDYQDYLISFLPLAHIFARVLEYTVLHFGCGIGFYSGTMSTLTDDLVALRPTIMAGVPRVFSKTYSKVYSQIQKKNFIARIAFKIAYKSKLKALLEGKTARFSDKIVFNQIKEKLGGRLRLAYNGAASLPYHIQEFLSVSLGVLIAEGYGLTETCGTTTCGQIVSFDKGNCGVPYRYSEVRLESVPEMDYLITDQPYPRGEICHRGPTMFLGYYKDEESTKKAIDEDGFYHTGDIGMWIPGPYRTDDDPNSKTFADSLRIIDRKKNIFKLSQGEFISAEKVEAALEKNCKWIKQVIVYGPSTSSALVAFVVPNWDLLISEDNEKETGASKWADGAVAAFRTQRKERPNEPIVKSAETEFDSPDELRKLLSTTPEAMSFVLAAVQRTAEGCPTEIKRYEIPKGIVLCEEEWGVDNKCMTPSMKVKREVVRQRWKEEFQQQLALIEEMDRQVLKTEKKTIQKRHGKKKEDKSELSQVKKDDPQPAPKEADVKPAEKEAKPTVESEKAPTEAKASEEEAKQTAESEYETTEAKPAEESSTQNPTEQETSDLKPAEEEQTTTDQIESEAKDEKEGDADEKTQDEATDGTGSKEQEEEKQDEPEKLSSEGEAGGESLSD